MTEKIYVNAEHEVLGRVASFVAKQALQGNEVIILNSEKAIISGRPENTLAKHKKLRAINLMKPRKGPFFSRNTEKIMKRTIRGMLPDFRVGRGREAFKRIKCYNGIPEELKKEKVISLKTQIPVKRMALKELGEKV